MKILKNKLRKVIALLAITTVICQGLSLTSYAAEKNTTNETSNHISARSGFSGYNAMFGRKSGSFKVNVTGPNGYGAVSATIRIRNTGKSTSFCITKDGSSVLPIRWRTVPSYNGAEQKVSLGNAGAGTYTVQFNCADSIDFLCWIYG